MQNQQRNDEVTTAHIQLTVLFLILKTYSKQQTTVSVHKKDIYMVLSLLVTKMLISTSQKSSIVAVSYLFSEWNPSLIQSSTTQLLCQKKRLHSLLQNLYKKFTWSSSYTNLQSSTSLNQNRNLVHFLFTKVRQVYANDIIDIKLDRLRQILAKNRYLSRFIKKNSKQK